MSSTLEMGTLRARAIQMFNKLSNSVSVLRGVIQDMSIRTEKVDRAFGQREGSASVLIRFEFSGNIMVSLRCIFKDPKGDNDWRPVEAHLTENGRVRSFDFMQMSGEVMHLHPVERPVSLVGVSKGPAQ